MKQFIATIGLLYLGLSGIGNGLDAQVSINIFNPNDVIRAKPIDETRFTVQYQATIVTDTLHPEKKEEETMMLKVGDKCSIYYSYAKYLTDSVFEADKASGTSQEVILEHLRQYNSKINAQIYKNYPAGKTTTLDALAASRFRCEEKEERPEWTLLPDTMTILSYPCRKAICHFKGRNYEAWYTPEIPRSEGPWKLSGLPGLILKAQDSQGHYAFTGTGIERSREKSPILFGGNDFEPISRNNLQKAYERYAADPIGYIALTSPQVKVTVTNDNGKSYQPKNMPYNPIER
ncbi:MAG: GLPGLI family protein [Parabacteroides sp.]|nr:GLPGLI family protein [Parabacteroides sp.]